MARKTAAPLDPGAVADEAAATKNLQNNAVLKQFTFAVNPVKLNRAKAYVSANQPTLKGAEYLDAVKERYVITGGLLRQDAESRANSKSRVENMAANDEDAE